MQWILGNRLILEASLHTPEHCTTAIGIPADASLSTDVQGRARLTTHIVYTVHYSQAGSVLCSTLSGARLHEFLGKACLHL